MAMTRRSAIKMLGASAVGAGAGSVAYGFWYGRRALELTQTTVSVTGWPESLDGLRVGLMTDIHRSEWVSEADVAHAVSLLMENRPDLIVLGGDYVTWGDRRYVDSAADALAALSAPYGVFGILGNHDDDRDMPAALAKRGIEVLKNARTRVTVRNDVIDIAGISFWTRRGSDIAAVVRGATAPVMLLAHDPRRLVEAAALGIPLVLSGHTHGGQVVLPVVGAVAARKFSVVSGTAQRSLTTVFVSRGVGTVYLPVRINCPPEVALLTLTPAVRRGA
jgi:predicted MPP superfamily phosphohydrolase